MLQLNSVVKYYNYKKSNQTTALNAVSINIADGEMLAIMGASGAGKSTMLHILGGLCRFESGSYLFDGKDITTFSDKQRCALRNSRIGVVLQNFALIDEYSVLQNAMTPLFFTKCSSAERKTRALAVLETVGIGDLKNKPVTEISGGEKQRCAIARAIVNNPTVILADEPTGQLDTKNAEKIIELLKELNSMGITVVIVTHEPKVASSCTRIITIEDGRIVERKNNR